MSDTLSVLMFRAGLETMTAEGLVAVTETPVEREEVSSSETLTLAVQTRVWLTTSTAVSNLAGHRGH